MEEGLTVRRPREMVLMNFEQVTVAAAMVVDSECMQAIR